MRCQEIICRGFVPDGNGGYRPYDELSDTEKKAFERKAVERMGKVFTDHCSVHPEAIPRILAAGEKMAVAEYQTHQADPSSA